MDGEQYAPGFVHLSLRMPLNAHALPICGPNSFQPHCFPGKTDVSSCILGAPGAPNELQNLIPVVQDLPSGARFLQKAAWANTLEACFMWSVGPGLIP